MSKYLFLITFILISFILKAQIDTVSVVSNISQQRDEFLKMPYSSEAISKLEKRDGIIESSSISNFKSYFFLFLLNLFTISVLLFDYTRAKVFKIIATLFNINMLKQYAHVEMKRDNKFLSAYFTLDAIFVIVVIFFLSNLFKVNIDIFKIGVIILVFFFLDFLLDKFSAYVMKKDEAYASVLFNNISFIIILLPILIIGILLLVFLPEEFSRVFAYFFIFSLFVIYLWKELRNIFILGASKIKVVSFYFFLYLCTFKILPFIVLLKVITVEILK